jgi:hypothetical protein
MMGTIAPSPWDGNETWLVVIGAGLFAAFPDVYAVFLGAFYFPVLLLLFGLIFRGIAFEFRFRSGRMRHVWDWGFFLGSTMVAFVQGAAVGAMMRGIPVVDGQYTGGPFGWLHPFTILTGIGLVLGYALLGAGWLVLKSEGELHDWAHRRIRWLAAGVFAVLFLAFTVTFDYSVLARAPFVRKTLRSCSRDRWLAGRHRGGGGQAARRTAVRDDRALLSRLLFDPGGDVLAVHDSLFPHGGGNSRAGGVTAISVLRRRRGPAGHRRLHDRRLLGLPRQGGQRLRLILHGSCFQDYWRLGGK